MAHLTPLQRQYVRKHTREEHLDPSEMVGELNIVPFLDIVVNLIMFLLMTVMLAVAITEIETQLPEYRRGVGSRSSEPENTLNLNLTVVEAGVIVTGSGGKLAPGCETTATGNVITVPRTRQGYDWAALTACVVKVKEQFPEERQVIVSADPLVQYEHVVAAMDAVRSHNDGNDELFPEVLISAGVR